MARKIKADWLVNVQGDLPFISAKTITRAVQPLRRDRNIPMGTVCTAIYDESEWRNPNIVKVLTDKAGLAICFLPVRRFPFAATTPSIQAARKSLDGASAGFGAIVISACMFTGGIFC